MTANQLPQSTQCTTTLSRWPMLKRRTSRLLVARPCLPLRALFLLKRLPLASLHKNTRCPKLPTLEDVQRPLTIDITPEIAETQSSSTEYEAEKEDGQAFFFLKREYRNRIKARYSPGTARIQPGLKKCMSPAGIVSDKAPPARHSKSGICWTIDVKEFMLIPENPPLLLEEISAPYYCQSIPIDTHRGYLEPTRRKSMRH
jgi:hypothetical protein